jgi:hypothetical protein
LDQEYGIFQHKWTLLVDFFSPACLEPTTMDDWDCLKRVATILGGSDSVDTAYKLVQYNHIVLPQDDVHDFYFWISIRTGNANGHHEEMVRQKLPMATNWFTKSRIIGGVQEITTCSIITCTNCNIKRATGRQVVEEKQ